MSIKFLYTVIISGLFSAGPLFSQSAFFRPGTEWYFAFTTPGLIQARGYHVYKFERDTTVDGLNLHVLSLTTFISEYDDPEIPKDTFIEEPKLVYQSGDTLFQYYSGQLELLWINNLSPGSRFKVDDRTIFVDSVKNVMIDGIEVAKSFVHGGLEQIFFGDTTYYNLAGSGVLYDIFGPEGGFHFPTCWGFYDCYGVSLCKYKSFETGEIDVPGYYCENLLLSSPFTDHDDIHIFPNPATEYLIIDIPTLQHEKILALISSTGQVMYQEKVANAHTRIEVSDLPPGLYVCKIYHLNKVYSTKLIIHHI